MTPSITVIYSWYLRINFNMAKEIANKTCGNTKMYEH